MSRKCTLQRIAISALATVALAANSTSTALAGDRGSTPDPTAGEIKIGGSWCQKTPGRLECKIGSIRVLCVKNADGTGWSCGGCTSCGQPAPDDEPALRALIEDVTTYLARIGGSAKISR